MNGREREREEEKGRDVGGKGRRGDERDGETARL